MRCAACGHENPDENRFCGRCGASLRVASEPEPITGHSFLGLGVTDVLEEDEPRSGWNWRLGLALAFLALVAILGWMQWRQMYQSAARDVEQTAQQTATEPLPAPTEQPAAEESSTEEAAEGATDTAPARSGVTEPQEIAPAAEEEPSAEPEREAARATEEPQKEPAQEETESPSEKAADEADADDIADEPAAIASAGQEELATARRMLANGDSQGAARWLWKATSLGNAEAPVLLAQLYLGGGDGERSCEQALVLLNSAARKPNARARAQLARLYADGECVGRDRMAAYHWFTLALAVEPENSMVRRERELVWQQMSELERQEARAMEKSTASVRAPL